jgi:general secretion pathway protein C
VLDALSLRRATRAVRAALIVLAAYGAALAVNAAVALTLGEDIPARSAATAASPRGTQASAIDPAMVSYAPIFERNLFGSEPLEAPTGGTASAAPGHADLILRGTASIDGRGFAVFEQRDSGKQDVFGIGENVFDGPALVSVQETTAVISAGGRRVTLEITEQDKDIVKGKYKRAPAGAGAGSGIRRTGDGTYLVDRREVEHSIENLSTVITKMRAVPYLKDGESLGFRVFNIRPGSIFERMGLRNGDVIQNVNGTELKDPQRALMLLDTVASASEIRVDLLRGQAPTSLTYTIR